MVQPKENLLYRLLTVFYAMFFLFPVQAKEFYSVNERFGISVREVCSVCTDDNGFIWASSKTAIMRIADDNLKTYSLPYSTRNIQTVKLSYSADKLIAYDNNGQCFLLDRVTDRFVPLFDFRPALDDEYITVSTILIESDTVYWASTSQGVFRCTTHGALRKVLPKENIDLNWALSLFDASNLLVASVDGLGIINKETLEYTELHKADARLNSESLFYDMKTSAIWIGSTAHGMLYLDISEPGNSLKREAGVPGQPILTICPYDSTHILAGTNGSGLFCIDIVNHSILFSESEDINNPTSLNGNAVYSICCKDDIFWVGTRTGGLEFFDRNPSDVFTIAHRQYDDNSLISNEVNSTLSDRTARVWVATPNGVDVCRVRDHNWKHLLSGHNCTSLFQDLDGNIWAGTFGDGYYVIDSRTLSVIRHSTDCLYAMAFCQDSDGDMWIGGVQCVICIRKDGTQRRYQDMSVYSMDELENGKMILACAHALVTIEKNSGTVTTLADGLILDLAVSDRKVWAASTGRGVLCHDTQTGKNQYFTISDGLVSDYTRSLLLSGDTLWIGTEKGICRMLLQSREFQYLSDTQALANLYCNTAAVGRMGQELVWGTDRGLVLFDPSRTINDKNGTQIWIDDILFAGQSAKERQEWNQGRIVNDMEDYSISHDLNEVDIDWIPLGSPYDNVRMYWALDDEEWNIHTGNSPEIRIHNIPTGKHTVRLKLCDSMNGNVLSEREIQVRVIPPLWRRWWFIMISILLLSYIVYVSLGYYTASIKSRVVPIVSINRAVDMVDRDQRNPESHDPFVKLAVQVVYDNMHNPDFGKEQFASALNVSQSLLYKKLKALTGQSPTDFIRTIRMSQALKLLQEGTHSITEVSELCGYSTSGYFSTVFKNFYGKSPSDI